MISNQTLSIVLLTKKLSLSLGHSCRIKLFYNFCYFPVNSKTLLVFPKSLEESNFGLREIFMLLDAYGDVLHIVLVHAKLAHSMIQTISLFF